MIKGKFFRPGLLALGISFMAAQALWRFHEQLQISKVVTRSGLKLLKTYDLRGADHVMSIILRRESDAFRGRVKSRQSKIFYWPGLKAAQTSWVWMQALSGLHVESSFQGDYSWLFSKLDFINRSVPSGKDLRSFSLAPFFLVIGSDGVGSTLLVQEWSRTFEDYWKTWFYAGYHAIENLNDTKLASDYFQRALTFKETPDFVAALMLRLKDPSAFSEKKNRDLLLGDLDPALLVRLKRARPEWFR